MTSKKDNIKMQRVVNFTCDEKIADNIIKLHDKGYYTVFSCAGHEEDEFISPYIMFDYIGTVGLSLIMGGGNEAPEHWEAEYQIDECTNMPINYIIRRYFTEEEFEKYGGAEVLIDIAMAELELWIFTLPKNHFDIYTTGNTRKVFD